MSSFAQITGGGDTKFHVRWRGKQEGPYPASVIEAKLAANEIGLLHEIYHEGKWVTIRDYLSQREAIVVAERQAKEEHERRAREEAEKLARAREEQRQLELLAEDRRKAAQLESAQSQQTQNLHSHASPSPSSDRGSQGLRTFGILLLIAGLAIAAFFFLGFDTSVESGAGRVNNLGLMADRQNGVVIGIGLAVVGAIMLTIGFRNKN